MHRQLHNAPIRRRRNQRQVLPHRLLLHLHQCRLQTEAPMSSTSITDASLRVPNSMSPDTVIFSLHLSRPSVHVPALKLLTFSTDQILVSPFYFFPTIHERNHTRHAVGEKNAVFNPTIIRLVQLYTNVSSPRTRVRLPSCQTHDVCSHGQLSPCSYYKSFYFKIQRLLLSPYHCSLLSRSKL